MKPKAQNIFPVISNHRPFARSHCAGEISPRYEGLYFHRLETSQAQSNHKPMLAHACPHAGARVSRVLRSPEVIEQKAEYIHTNPPIAGFVTEAWHWQHSSAVDYSGGKGLIEIEYL